MTRYLTAFTLAVCVALTASADDIAIAPGKFADIKLTHAAGAKINRLSVSPEPVQKVTDVPGRLIFIGEPGVTYKVRHVIVDFKKEIYDEVEHFVTFSGEKREKRDDKRDDKKDDKRDDKKDDPPAGPFWIIVVEESSARTSDTAAILADTALWDALTAKGHKWRVYDRDNATAKTKGYSSKAEALGLPAVLLLDGAGTVTRGFKLSRVELDALK